MFRTLDKRFETGEILIKYDDTPEDEWLMLIYIKNNNPEEGIIVEDKTILKKISHMNLKQMRFSRLVI